MRRLLIIGCVYCATTGVLESQDSNDLVIVSRSKYRTVIEFRPVYKETAGGQGSITAPGLEQGIAPQGIPGAPFLPYRGLTIPLQGPRVRVRVLESGFRDRIGVLPLPRPGFVADPAFGASREFGTLKKQGVRGFFPAEVAVVADIAPTRARYEGTLRMYPLQFDESGNTLRQYDRIVVAVDSEPEIEPAGVRNTAANPLAQGEWYKLEVEEAGMIKLDQAFFSSAGVSLGSLPNIQTIRIFGNGGASLPEDLLQPRPAGLEEIARMIIDQDNDGVFDPEDYVLFYGASPHSWRYNPQVKSYSHVTNYYSNRNAYFLTFGGTAGRDMDILASTNTPGVPVASDARGMQVYEEELHNLLNSGRQWYGRLFDTDSPTASFATTLPGFNPAIPITYKIAVVGRAGSTSSFSVEENGNGNTLGSITILPVNLPSIESEYAYAAPVAAFTRTWSLPDDRSVLRLTYQSAGGEGWLDWFEIHYRRSLQAVNDFIMFPTDDTTSVMEHHLSGFSSSGMMVFDISDHDSVVQITDLDVVDPGACSFQIPLSSGTPRWLAAIGPTGFKTPAAVSQIGNSDVRGITAGAEFVIIAPKEFQPEADRLRSHREQNDSLSTLVVRIEDLTNEYTGGVTDPMAVRDFLAEAVQSWAIPPEYVLLLGDAHYDYKNRRTSDRNWIPPYESLESLHQIDTFASDDRLAMLFPGNPRVSLALGRLPVNSSEEARRVVDKIIEYESTAPFGEWRNRATFVADDGLTSTGDDGSIHTFQAEEVAQKYTPMGMQKKKIYLIEYPTVNSSSGRRKPAVNSAIVDAVNNGTLLLNYTGHGNPQLWAHEAVFTREGSVAQLQNGERLFLLIAATCDFARYDDPSEVSTGELLLTMENGGAIGAVTASRAVYSSDNFQFNNTLSTELFKMDSLGVPPRIGDALRRTKQIHYGLNDLKYHLFGDPTVRLNLPGNTAGIDSLNGSPLDSLTQIRALGKIDVAGEIRRRDGSRWADFHGQALLEMYDARRTVIIPEWGNFSFAVNGSLLYRGDISVNAGAFQARVPVPKDVSYDANRARISIYAWTPSADATGFTENIIIAGTDSSAAVDTTGPGIEIFLNDESFRLGDVVPPDPELIVRLFDENGINTSTAGVGHGLEARLSGTGGTINLSEYYLGERDTYQSGTVRLQLRGLPEGTQTIEVKAWDTYNNSSRNEILFDVKAVSDLRLYQVYNFPNPVSRSTVFTFQRTSTEPIDVQVKVYTIAGRLVLEMVIPSVIDRFVRIPWDGRDQNGDQVANGVYFYKIITRTPSGSQSEEAFGKLTMLR